MLEVEVSGMSDCPLPHFLLMDTKHGLVTPEPGHGHIP